MTPAEYALSCVGKSRYDLGLNKSGEWCAEFVSHCIEKTVDPSGSLSSISCNEMKKLMKNDKRIIEPDGPMLPSDYFFFDHDREKDPLKDSKPLDHVAIVVGFDGEYVEYVDGNGDSSGLVKKRKRHISTFNFDCKYPDYYLRFVGEEKEPDPEPVENKTEEWKLPVLVRGEFGKSVKVLQYILSAEKFNIGSCGVDGLFGPDTENAVKTYQNAVGLPETGIVDLATWKSLLI